ncbi:MAG TPA: DUF4194 domain-containing protein [Roseiflexaceae bacterium]|jgi:hypothetical protein|nr:DUF4194 domain-containing protein [Roseiflexaceae bacterium]
MKSENIESYAPVLIKLLQGIIAYDDAAIWSLLLYHEAAIHEYFERAGLHVEVDETEGYAFLRQPDPEEDSSVAMTLPRLTSRHRLSYPVTLLLVLLHEALQQFDASESQSDRLVVTIEELRDMQRPFQRERSDEVKLARSLDAHVSRLVELGFLRRLSGDEERYEVRRIIKAKVPADMLAEIKEKLVAHAQSHV